MTKSIRKMPSLGGIGAGQTATRGLPIGLTYEMLMIRMKVTKNGAKIDVPNDKWHEYLGEIRLVVNGETTYTRDAADIVLYNEHHKQAATPGVLNIFLARPWALTAGGQDETAYKTGAGVATFTIEIEQKAGIEIDELSVYAEQSPGVVNGVPRAWGSHMNVKRFHKQQGLVGVSEISDLPRGAYQMLGIQVNTDDIATAEVVVNNNKFLEVDQAMLWNSYDRSKRQKIAGQTFLGFDTGGRLAEAMPMAVQDFRLKLDFTATGNFTLYTESIYPQ